MEDNKNTMTFSIDKEREEYHARKKKRKMIRLYIALVIWVIIITFLCTPFATYKMMHVDGNVYLSEEEILEYAKIKNVWWWAIDADKVKNKLEEHHDIDNVSISFTWEGLHISILEKYPIATLNIDGKDYYIMNTSFDPVLKSEHKYDIDNLIDITNLDESKRNEFIKEYSNVDLDIRSNFYGLESTLDEDVVVLKGKFNENAYFDIEIDLEYLSFKLDNEKFINIKEEILGELAKSNVKYGIDNPLYVDYNLTYNQDYKVEYK